MVTFTMSLISIVVYTTRKSWTFETNEYTIRNRINDLKELVENTALYTDNFEESVIDILEDKQYYDNGFAFLLNTDDEWVYPPPERFSNYFTVRSVSSIISDPAEIINIDGHFGNCLVFKTHVVNEQYVLGISVFEQDFWYPTRAYTLMLIILLIPAGIILFTILLHFIMQPLTRHLTILANKIKTLSKGILPEKSTSLKRKDEIAKISDSVNELIDGLKMTVKFAVEIGKGNYDYEHKILSEDDVLGNSLLETRESLKKASEEQKLRKIEEEKRNWATQGLAEFSDILRIDYNNIDDLGFRIIQKLIKYLDINQGGLFIVNDEDPNNIVLELIACYAFDRQKFVSEKFKPGESLVGACYLERKTTHIKKVPNTYISITSGLGEANPSSLLLVPLVLNEDIFGVIELASFKEFPQYKIEFVEKVAESIASSISNAKTNEKTKQLLKQSQTQAEQMTLQEKEMKQNMEEMQATQEEMQRLLSLNNLRIDQAKAVSSVRELCNNTNLSNKELFEKVINIMAKGWQHSENAATKINYKDIFVESDNYMDTPWKISEEIEVDKSDMLIIEVVYTKEYPDADVGPFLNEEVELVKNIGALLKAFLKS